MRHPVLTAAVAVVAMTVAVAASAQQTKEIHPGRGGSPHVQTDWTVDGAKISIQYGRPYLKGRPEAQLMPSGKPWRTGADEATTLVTDKPLKFGSLSVPAGTYTLFTLPGESAWQLIVSKQTGQWGTQYSEAQDLGRAPMKIEKAASPVEQLTVTIDDTPAGGTLKVSWGTTVASIPFTVG
jgi:hypothetical protein